MSAVLATITSYQNENLLLIFGFLVAAWIIIFGLLFSTRSEKPVWNFSTAGQRAIIVWSWFWTAGAVSCLVTGWGFLTWRLSNGRMLVPTAPEMVDGIVYGFVLLGAAVMLLSGWLLRVLVPPRVQPAKDQPPAPNANVATPARTASPAPADEPLYQPLYPGLSFEPLRQPPTSRTRLVPQRPDQQLAEEEPEELEQQEQQEQRKRPRGRRLVFAGAVAVLVVALVGTFGLNGTPTAPTALNQFDGASIAAFFTGFFSKLEVEQTAEVSGDIIPDSELDFQINGDEAREGDFAFDAGRWRPLAQQGNAIAQYKLGVMYANGRGVPRDYVEAYKWLNIAGAQSHEKAIAGRNAVAGKMTLAEIETAQNLAREELAVISGGDEFTGEIPVRLTALTPRELVSAGQTLLKDRGYNAGPSDGLVGPRTRAAVRQYQRDSGLPPTGEITLEIVARLEKRDAAPVASKTSKLGPTAILTPSLAPVAPTPVATGRRSAPVTDCDTLAAHPSSSVGFPGVDFARIDAARAISACEQAIAQFPDELRFQYQLARSLHRAERHSDALNMYRKTGEQGFALAQRSVGFMYANANGVAQDLNQAAIWLRQAADRCDVDAQFALGTLYAEGQGVGKSEAESARWFRMAAAQDHVEARNRLKDFRNLGATPTDAVLNGKDEFEPADFTVARHVENLLASQDREIVEAFERQDYEAVLDRVRPLAEQDTASAQTLLGYMYRSGLGVEKNDTVAAEWYTKAAEQNEPNAQYLLGFMYQRGYGVPQYFAQALQWYRKSGGQGVAGASLNLGEMYDNAQGVTRDRDEALVQYFRAAEAGLAGAQHKLGLAYENGDGVPNDIEQALNWYRNAAAQNFALSQFKLGELYSRGRGVTRNRDEAVRWYRLAADQGLPAAQFSLAKALSVGQGARRDLSQSLTLYSMAAKQGHVEGQVNLAFAYLKGSGVERNPSAAVDWFQKAAAQCNADAQYQLARLHGAGEGVSQASTAEELKFLKLASEQGHAAALQALSVRYAQGKGVAKDPAKALKSTQRAALLGHSRAQFELAETYADGSETVPQDHALAAVWYRKAALQGHGEAQLKLARLYREGLGVARSNVEAVAWYRLAAERGDREAQYNLATAYRLGAGVERDDTEAVTWYQRAAEQGDATSQRELGLQYLRGEGVLQDFVQARVWLGLAADNGDAKASETLSSLTGKLTPKQLSEAERLTKEKQASDS